jgi:hypothetical protein
LKIKIALYSFLLLGLLLSYQYVPNVFKRDWFAPEMERDIFLITSGEGSPILHLALDLNDDGIQASALKAPPAVLFDHLGNGVKIGTSWISPNDGLLVFDRNMNGVVDNGTELFGNRMPSSSIPKPHDSFTALAEQDSNHDGVIDELDSGYSKLMVWQDLNQDGISQSAELKFISQYKIKAININAIRRQQDGTQFVTVRYQHIDGRNTQLTHKIVSVNFKVNPFYRAFVKPIALTSEVEALPDMRGSGMVRDMREAASISPIFAQKLAEYATANTREAQLLRLDDLVNAWGNTTNFPNMKIRAAANDYDLTIEDMDVKHLSLFTAMEQFNGDSFFAMPWEEHIGNVARYGLATAWDGNSKHLKVKMPLEQFNIVEHGYQALTASVYRSLLPQTRLKPYLDQVRMIINKGGISLDYTQVENAFRKMGKVNSEKAIIDLIEFNQFAKARQESGWVSQGESLLTELLKDAVLTPTLKKSLHDFSLSANNFSNTGGK